MKKINLKTVVYKEGKKWSAICLDYEVASCGTTKKSALTNLNEALELYFEDLKPSAKYSAKQPDIVTLNVHYA